MIKKLLLAFISVCFCCFTISAQTISGVVKDAKTNETLIGANVVIKGTTNGAITNVDGKFSIKYENAFPATIVISYVGYLSQEAVVENDKEVTLKLSANEVQLKGAEVSGSRISEKQKESPLTVEAMDIIAIKETPAANFYEGLGQLKGVDLTSASIGFKVINTRGFNSTSPVRSLQIIDGVDNQSPGLNFSLGNFLGSSELDVQKVDLVVGASSAFYGPNAFNGVISMTTRSPFIKPGLEVFYKMGERDMIETGFRWAEVFKNKEGQEKFAYKLNMSFFQANDWEANNLSPTQQSKNGESNTGGYDAVNIYGDEYINGTDYTKNAGAFPGLGVYYRKGYAEKDLVDYNTKNGKLGVAFHYKIMPDIEAILSSNFGTGTTIYQGDNRYSLKDIWFLQNRIEVKKENKWFIRAYSTNENAGKSYDAYFTALLLQKAAKSDGDWKIDYENYWNDHYGLGYVRTFPGFPQPPGPGPAYVEWLNQINPFLDQNYHDSLVVFHQNAQEFATGIGNPNNQNYPYFEPGTMQFDTAFAGITSRKSYGEGGSRFFDKSALYHVHGEYKFTTEVMDITVGGNYRMYRPNSEGTIFSDTNGVKIKNSEFGFYAGIEKNVLDEKLKLNVTARLDKNENFDYLISPAISAVYQAFKENYFRVSFSSAIRNPTLTDQYLYYQVGRAILIGNKDGYNDLVTVPSLIRFYDLNKNFDSLSFFNVKPVRPEEVKTLEGGYRATLFERLYIDLGGYYSWYNYFIGYKLGVDVDTFSYQSPFGGTIRDLNINNALRVATNSEDKVTTAGFSIGVNYYFGKHYAAIANYSWNKLDLHGSTDPLIPAFNTPENKYNIGINGREINNWGFNINYKWVEGFQFEGSPQFTGYIDSYDMVDVQVNRKFPELYSTLKLGASNALNNKHYEVYGGPQVGRLIYFSVLIEIN